MCETPQDDAFDSLLSLEDQYYNEGRALGVADGARSGRIEGRVFGLEKGFEKFASMGALAGRCSIWEARLSTSLTRIGSDGKDIVSKQGYNDGLAPLASNSRLEKHVQTLSALVEAESLSTQNNEDAVSDFDDRLKRAEGKAKVISSIIGESVPSSDGGSNSSSSKKIALRDTKSRDSNMEDFNTSKARS